MKSFMHIVSGETNFIYQEMKNFEVKTELHTIESKREDRLDFQKHVDQLENLIINELQKQDITLQEFKDFLEGKDGNRDLIFDRNSPTRKGEG